MVLVAENTFARFHDMRVVRQCLRELRRGQLWREHMRVIVHTTKKGSEELPLSLTHARGAMLRGVLTGAGIGLAAGIAISLVEAAGHGFDAVFVAAFCLFGLVMGGFAGVLTGTMSPDPEVEKIEKSGDLVIAVESTEAADIDWAASIFKRWGSEPQFRTRGPRLEDHPARAQRA
ncbi:MAG: hypothetical protein HOW73_44460 [Polyangiaceae bacterium]|nr:hypothetical protein [Polyangiaceae bacterium]